MPAEAGGMYHKRKENAMTCFIRPTLLSLIPLLLILIAPSAQGQQRSARPKPPNPVIRVVSQEEYDSLIYYSHPRALMAADRIRNHRLVSTTYFYRTGEIMARMYYDDGLQVENEEWYWRNGNLQHLFPYRGGFPHGVAYDFDYAGNPVDSSLFIEGRKSSFDLFKENFSNRGSMAGR